MKKAWMCAFAALALSINGYADEAEETTTESEVVAENDKKEDTCNESECSSDVAETTAAESETVAS